MQETVIAKKSYSVLVSYIAIIVIGAFLAGISIMALLQTESQYRILAAAGMVLAAITIGLGIFFIIRFAKLPKNVITYKDDTLYLPNGIYCTPADITSCKSYVNRDRYGFASRHGSLVLTINGKKYKYVGINDVRLVRERLEMLRNEYLQKQMSEQHRQENPQKEPVEDPFDL